MLAEMRSYSFHFRPLRVQTAQGLPIGRPTPLAQPDTQSPQVDGRAHLQRLPFRGHCSFQQCDAAARETANYTMAS